MVLKSINSKQIILEILNTSKADNMKKTGLYGYVDDFSFYYDSTAVDDILDIHNYLKVRNNIKCLGLLNKYLLHYLVLVGPEQQNLCI